MGAVGRTNRGRAARGPIVVAVLAAAALVAAAGCSSGGETATATTPPSVTTAPAAESTTTERPSSTTTPGAAAGAAALGSKDDPGSGSGTERTTTAGPDGLVDADEEAENVTWAVAATDYRGEDGLLVAYDCPPDGAVGSVWGVDTYTDDSSVCTAAVHAGLITAAEGGVVVIEIGAGLEAYEGSTANGVTTLPYGSWSGSFSFPDA